MPPSLLFLSLDTFSRTGGIQQFNRVMSKALADRTSNGEWTATHFSLYDHEPDSRYQPAKDFRGFGKKRLAFFLAVLKAARSGNLVILGHVNLLSLVPWIRRVNRSVRVALVVHGVEAWQPLQGPKARGLQQSDTVWAVSSFTAAQWVQAQQWPAAQTMLLPNALDPFFAASGVADEAEMRKYLRLAPGGRYLLTVARLAATETGKGYDAVLNVLPRLKQQFPNLFYILAGRYEPEEYERLQRRISDLHLQGSVIMPGYVNSRLLPALYAMSEIFVMPSTKEGFGIVYLEAAWAGCKVVASDSGGSGEALLKGRIGVLVPPGDEQALELALANCLNDPLTQDKKEANRQLIETHYSETAFSERLSHLVGSIL